MEESVLSKTIVKDLKVLAKTNFLSLYNADYINKGGKEKTWTIATRKSKEALEEQFFQGKEDKMDAVVILAYHKEEKKLVAIKQFRVPLNNYVYELPAGLIDNNDDIISTVERELKEETGLTLTSYKLRGLVTFISDKCEPELMCVFTANEYIGELTECNEGELYWIDKAVVPTLPTWEGDRVFLDLLLSGDERFFSLKLQYEGEKLVDKQVNLY